jgi:hypothetical protein
VVESQHVNGADLDFGSSRLDYSDWRLVRPGMPAMHDERNGQAVAALNDLQRLRAQAREGCMEGSGSRSEINQRQI